MGRKGARSCAICGEEMVFSGGCFTTLPIMCCASRQAHTRHLRHQRRKK